MAELFHKTFATDLSEFDSTGASNGTIEQSAGSGLNGTTGGVLYTQTGASPNLYGVVPIVASALTAFRVAWYTDLSNIAIANNGQRTILYIPQSSVGSALGYLDIIRLSGALNFRIFTLPDSGSNETATVPLSGYPAWVELTYGKETSDGNEDGTMRLYAGGGDYAALGELLVELTAIPNFVTFASVINGRIGMNSSGSTITGSLVVDEIIAHNDDTPILFGVSQSSRSLGMSYVLNRRRRKQQCW